MRADRDVVEAVRLALRPGKERAQTGRELAKMLSLCGIPVHQRRVGEAVAALVEEGCPVCSSSDGYYLATRAAELEESLAQTEKRARAMLRKRRLLRQRMAELDGQKRLEAA